MKGRPIDLLVYQQMYPKPKSSDPQNFNTLLQRCLIPEVRHETHAFFGHLDTQEAKYPGLDYNHPTHRIRLSRWPWHKRMFNAFDALGLTKSEVSGLTKWEGTRWAKEKYEREQGVKIRDTTNDGFPDWVEPEESVSSPVRTSGRNLRLPALTQALLADEEEPESQKSEDEEEPEAEDVEENSEDEDLAHSVGVELNARLIARAAQRDAGETDQVLDEEWDQWFKAVMESGELSNMTGPMRDRMLGGNSSSPGLTAGRIPSFLLNFARAGQWSAIPEILHPVLRRTIESENPNSGQSTRAASSLPEFGHRVAGDVVTGGWIPTTSGLRLPRETGRSGA